MMDVTIVISVAGMALTAALAYFGAQRGIAAQLAKVEAKVDALSTRVERHNCVIERTAALEERVRWIEEEVRRDGR